MSHSKNILGASDMFSILQQYSKSFYFCTQIVVYPNCYVPYLHYVWIYWNHHNCISKLLCSSILKGILLVYPNCHGPTLRCSWFAYQLIYNHSDVPVLDWNQISFTWKSLRSFYECINFTMYPFCVLTFFDLKKSRQESETRQDKTWQDKTRRIKIDTALVLRT